MSAAATAAHAPRAARDDGGSGDDAPCASPVAARRTTSDDSRLAKSGVASAHRPDTPTDAPSTRSPPQRCAHTPPAGCTAR